MDEIRLHPYIVTAAVVAIVVGVGTLIVAERASKPVGGSSGWNGDNALPLNPIVSNNAAAQTLRDFTPQLGTTSAPFIPLGAGGESGNYTDGFDMAAFIRSLSQPLQSTSVETNTDVSASYSFIPQGLISTSTGARRTKEQQALYDYGNEAGSYIETYQDTHQNAPQVMKAQFEDRQNAEKAQALRDIGTALTQVGLALDHIEEVPGSVASANTLLAKSYKEVGAKLSQIPDAQRDEDLAKAIQTYNAAADDLTKHYVSLALLLSLSGVTFELQDPGSVFTFTQGSGL